MSWKELQKDINSGNIIGNYGAENSDFFILSKAKFDIEISDYCKEESKDEEIDKQLNELIQFNSKKIIWDKISSINPFGMTSSPKSIACVRAKLELKDMLMMKKDGIIVNKEGMVNCLKIAINYTWHLDKIAKKLNIPIEKLRNTFFEKTKNSDFLNKDLKIYNPTLPGISIFAFGDISKLKYSDTKVTLRIHDACLNSDCFRGTICTCAPYLMYGIEKAIETAQNGGVGLIFYYKKEGRSLGEVIKFRVYSARNKQEGGDRSDTYFDKTKEIAGIEDIRFQELMPDALLWLGIEKIDNLYSMSNVKYQALIDSGIKVINRHEIPEHLVHPDAQVEINAKISSGYFKAK